MRPSTRSVLPCSTSVGADGATLSSVKAKAPLAGLALPALSVMTAVSALAPSMPRSLAVIVKSMYPLAIWDSVRARGTTKATPSSSSPTWSPATAACGPVAGRVTRKKVLCASTAFMRPSARSALPCSDSVGIPGAVVSISGSGGTSMFGRAPPLAV